MATHELGSDENGCSVSIALLGTRSSDRRYLATLSTEAEVGLWLDSHQDTYIDPEQWRAVVVGSRRGRFQIDTKFIRAGDWNHGARWDALLV